MLQLERKLRYSGFHPLKAEAVVAQRPPGPCRRTQSWLEMGSPVTADGVSDPQESDFHRKATLLRGRPSLEALWGKRRLCGRSCLLGYGTRVVPAGPGGQREGGRRQHEGRILPGFRTEAVGPGVFACLVTPSPCERLRPEVRPAPVCQGLATTTGGLTPRHLLFGHTQSLHDIPTPSKDLKLPLSDSD